MLSRKLRVNHSDLKRRADTAGHSRRSTPGGTKAKNSQTLVPVKVVPLQSMTPSPVCIVRIQSSKGAMEICLNNGHDTDIAGFVSSFMGGER
jgi:hypothetical protein